MGKKYGARDIKKLLLLVITLPLFEDTLNSLIFPLNKIVQNACVNSWPKTYTRPGTDFTRKTAKKITKPVRNQISEEFKGIRETTSFPNDINNPIANGINATAITDLMKICKFCFFLCVSPDKAPCPTAL